MPGPPPPVLPVNPAPPPPLPVDPPVEILPVPETTQAPNPFVSNPFVDNMGGTAGSANDPYGITQARPRPNLFSGPQGGPFRRPRVITYLDKGRTVKRAKKKRLLLKLALPSLPFRAGHLKLFHRLYLAILNLCKLQIFSGQCGGRGLRFAI